MFFCQPFSRKVQTASLEGDLNWGWGDTTTGQCANRSIKSRNRGSSDGNVDLLAPLPGMPLGRATSHLSPGEPVCMRPTQWTRREASVYSQGREHLPPSAVEKLCGDKSRAECHCCVCGVSQPPAPDTEPELSRQQARPKLAFLFSSGVS